MESIIEQSCPICFADKGLKLFVHISEIPYFGEHTQMTMLCDECGWKNTDFIPAEGKKPGAWSFIISDISHMSTRVVRSSSCDNIEKCLILLDKINEIKKGKKEVEMILLDPMGHSQILHKDAKSRDLDEVEIAELPTGPSIPVLNLNED